MFRSSVNFSSNVLAGFPLNFWITLSICKYSASYLLFSKQWAGFILSFWAGFISTGWLSDSSKWGQNKTSGSLPSAQIFIILQTPPLLWNRKSTENIWNNGKFWAAIGAWQQGSFGQWRGSAEVRLMDKTNGKDFPASPNAHSSTFILKCPTHHGKGYSVT